MDIQLIDQIHYASINNIRSYADHNGKISITALWSEIPMRIASAEIVTTSRQDSAGTSYAITINAAFRYMPEYLPACILRVTLCSGKQLIVGSPDMPVTIATSSTLATRRFTITHNSIYPPQEIVQ